MQSMDGGDIHLEGKLKEERAVHDKYEEEGEDKRSAALGFALRARHFSNLPSTDNCDLMKPIRFADTVVRREY